MLLLLNCLIRIWIQAIYTFFHECYALFQKRFPLVVGVHFLWTNNDKRGFREAVFLFCCLVFLSIMYLDLNRIDVMLAFCTSCIRLKNFANSSSFQYVLTCLWEKKPLLSFILLLFDQDHTNDISKLPWSFFLFTWNCCWQNLATKESFFFLHCRERETS